MLNRKVFLFLLLAIILSCIQISLADEIVVKVDEQQVNFDVQPQLKEGWVFVPLRGVFEKMGAVVNYSRKDGTVLVQKQNILIHLKSGSSRAYINDNSIFLFVIPYEFKGRTMVPLRFITEALGCQVAWDPSSKIVSIDTKTSTSTEIPPED